MDRKELVEKGIQEIYGNRVPSLYWYDYDDIRIKYDNESDSFITEDGISMKFDLKNGLINWDNMYDYLIRFQIYVREQYKIRYNKEIDFDW
jgi:hypothetical protein